MTKLWFIVPAAGRLSLTRVCLRQLRRTCDALKEHEIDASAVVISDDQNLATADQLGFATVQRNNYFTARKFNDGIQLACDDRYNPRPADYVVPCGSDDWVDHRLFLTLPPKDTVLAFRWAAFVDETGTVITPRRLDYDGGVGIRVYPRELMARLNYRPADEDRKRACDTSILVNLRQTYVHGGEPKITYGDLHEYQVVDWKSHGTQITSYRTIMARHAVGQPSEKPFEALAGVYPKQALREMQAHYTSQHSLMVA